MGIKILWTSHSSKKPEKALALKYIELFASKYDSEIIGLQQNRRTK